MMSSTAASPVPDESGPIVVVHVGAGFDAALTWGKFRPGPQFFALAAARFSRLVPVPRQARVPRLAHPLLACARMTHTAFTQDPLSLRARAEYTEMPGLKLTLAQAARLFDLAPDVCARTLEGLVGEGFLRRAGANYARADSGRRYA